MKKIAVTGNIGSGKSTICHILQDMGYPLFDADQQIRDIYENDTEFYNEITSLDASLTKDGKISKPKIIEKISQNTYFLEEIENILYPLLDQKKEAFCEQYKDKKITIFEIPLLFEKQNNDFYDHIILIHAPYDIRWDRVRVRPNMSKSKFEMLNQKQLSHDDIPDHLCYKISTDIPREALLPAIEKFLEFIKL